MAPDADDWWITGPCRRIDGDPLEGSEQIMNDQARNITVNGKKYLVDDLSDNAKAQLTNIRVVDQEISRLETLLAIAKTARAAYAQVLGGEVEKTKAN